MAETKIDIEALLEAYRQRLRAQIGEGETPEEKSYSEQSYRIHSMFQEPAMRYLCEVFNAASGAGHVDYVRVGLNLSVAFATAISTYLAYVPTEDQPVALNLMMNNIFSSVSRLMAEQASLPEDKRMTVEEFTRPVN